MSLGIPPDALRRAASAKLGVALIAALAAVLAHTRTVLDAEEPALRSGPKAAAAGPAAPEAAATGVAIGKNLLLNGDLRAGSGDSPDHWRSGAWEQKPGMTDFQWLRHGSAPGELRVAVRKPNDARWTQTLTLNPGWFYLSAKIRAEHVSGGAQGASLSILEGAIGSLDLRGTTEWQRRGFYLKVGPRGADIEVACRLGGFASLNTGIAMCSDLSVVPIAVPPPGAAPVFDLDQVRRQYATPPVGTPWTLAAAFAFTLALALLGWTMLGGATLAGLIAPNPRRSPHATPPD